MKRQNTKARLAEILFTLTLALFFSFFCYMTAAERVTVYHAEQNHSYTVLTDMELELAEDDMAPVGIRKIYRGILNPEISEESCLCFNIAHHNIQVYFQDELVYSLSGMEHNRIGKNVSSNWCSVHVGQTHVGETVTVVLTPLFEAAVSKEPEFLLGSHYAIAMDVLLGEMPLLVLSALCILLGIFVVAVFFYFRYVLKNVNGGMAYLGFFSLSLGLWKLTDLRCMPLLLPEHSMAIGYISVGALFLTGMCLLPYFATLFTEGERGFLQSLSCCGSLICLGVLAVQVLGIAELRQNLLLSHGLLIISLGAIPVAALYNRIFRKKWGLIRSSRLLVILFLGIAVDLLLFYRNNGNGLLSFSIMGLVIYTLIVCMDGIRDATRKAYTDSRTGLVNRTRWNELMNSELPLPEPYGILVIDLNGLKAVNDTLGHEAGDRMIFQLSCILRNTLPRTSVICRWGGDEFTVLLTAVSRKKLDEQVDALYNAVEIYNREHPELPIYYAVGSALSSEYPGISRNDLFHLADEEMYRSNHRWYTRKQVQ